MTPALDPVGLPVLAAEDGIPPKPVQRSTESRAKDCKSIIY
jgi:hypothetical protein